MREITQRFQLVQDAAGLIVLVPAARARLRAARPLYLGVGVLERGVIVAATAARIDEACVGGRTAR